MSHVSPADVPAPQHLAGPRDLREARPPRDVAAAGEHSLQRHVSSWLQSRHLCMRARSLSPPSLRLALCEAVSEAAMPEQRTNNTNVILPSSNEPDTRWPCRRRNSCWTTGRNRSSNSRCWRLGYRATWQRQHHCVREGSGRAALVCAPAWPAAPGSGPSPCPCPCPCPFRGPFPAAPGRPMRPAALCLAPGWSVPRPH